MKLITGNTFPVKDKIKALGGKWDAEAKGWRVPPENEAQALALVAKTPAKAKRPRFNHNGCWACKERGSMCEQCRFDEYDM
jgi:hypothetical protein